MRNLSSPLSIESATQPRTCAIVATLTTAVWTEGRELRALRGTASGLAAVFAAMAGIPARLYLLAPEAHTVEQAMAPLHLLTLLGRTDVTAFASGELGGYGRLLAPWLGAPVVFGGLGHTGAHGLLTIERLLHDYPFPALPPVEDVVGIARPRVGWPH